MDKPHWQRKSTLKNKLRTYEPDGIKGIRPAFTEGASRRQV
jgi:hypothetical protein